MFTLPAGQKVKAIVGAIVTAITAFTGVVLVNADAPNAVTIPVLIAGIVAAYSAVFKAKNADPDDPYTGDVYTGAQDDEITA